MGMTRREFSMVASAVLLGAGALTGRTSRHSGRQPRARAVQPRASPGESAQQPGTWQAPRVLMDAGLREALEAYEVLRLPAAPVRFRGPAAHPHSQRPHDPCLFVRPGGESAGHPRGWPFPGSRSAATAACCSGVSMGRGSPAGAGSCTWTGTATSPRRRVTRRRRRSAPQPAWTSRSRAVAEKPS